jgi:hypothetical protein
VGTFWDKPWLAPVTRILEQVERLGGKERDWHLAGRYVALRIYWLPWRGSYDDGEKYKWHRPARWEKRSTDDKDS